MEEAKKIPKKRNLLNISIGGISLMNKVIFIRNLSIMLKSGLTIPEALDITEEQATGKLKSVIAGMSSSIRAGQSLSNAMGYYPKVFNPMIINIVRAGEISGSLDENLNNIADQLEKERELISKIRSAMLYPSVVLIAALGLGLGISFFILPKITPMFEGLNIELPFTTRALIAFSNFVKDHGKLLFIGIAVFIVLFIWLVKAKFTKPLTGWIVLHLPIAGKMVRNSNLSRFCYSLGTLLKSGINIDEALEITDSTLTNYYYRKAVKDVANGVVRGSPISTQLNNYPSLFPKLVSSMVKVGEETGQLESNLLFLAHIYELELDNNSKTLATAIEPLLLIFIGLMVAFLALSIITPIYKITGSVSK